MPCTNLLACDGSVGSPSIAFNSNTKLGFYRIGTDQMGFSAGTNGHVGDFGTFTITNTAPSPYGPNTVKYSSALYAQSLGTAVESSALYMKMNHSTSQFVYGIYGEIDSSQNGTGGSFTKVIHNGAGDAHYVANFGVGSIGYESASWANSTTGFLADVQIDGLSNAIMFNALWAQPTVPNYGMFVATAVPANALTISKYDLTHEGNVQIRITEPNYGVDRFEVFNSGQVNQIAAHSTSTATLTNAPEHRLVASYWNGTASVEQHAVIGHAMDSTTPASHFYLKIGPYASEQTICLLSPGQVDLQNSNVITCGGLTMKAGGANIDLQAGSVVSCGGLTMKAGGANADLQMGSLVNCATIQGGTTNLPIYVDANLIGQYGWDSVNSVGTFSLNIGTAASASAGSATLPANPLGFMLQILNGSFVKVPYYAV